MDFEILHFFRNDEEYGIEIRTNGTTLCRFDLQEYVNYLNEYNPYIIEAKHTNIFLN